MDIPYGYDCYAFSPNEVKFFDSKVRRAHTSAILPYDPQLDSSVAQREGYFDKISGKRLPGYIRFTRKNEDYTPEQINALIQVGRLQIEPNKDIQKSLLGKKIFCGIKIQLGMSVVTNFLQKGLQYRKPNKGRAELINGTWSGIVSGLTVDRDAPNSYDMAFGNFLAYDEEFPYIKFGPFFAIESKLVLLTGSARSLEASSFGTNIQARIWFGIMFLMLILSILAGLQVHWQHTKQKKMELLIRQIFLKHQKEQDNIDQDYFGKDLGEQSLANMFQNFLFIYFTMLLNKPSIEFDDYIWPKHDPDLREAIQVQLGSFKDNKRIKILLQENEELRKHFDEIINSKTKRLPLPTSVRIVSYLWSAACLVMTSIYSGEMLAVILLRSDQNIDTITQLINSKPQITPVIRQDDFTYNLMLKSLDKNMLILHNMTKIIPRPEVYTRSFIESVSERKQALLGDDELIETIYEIYHKYFPLYRSKMTYLQYPISIMYRKDLNVTLEDKLRRGLKQVFESGLLSRWYQAQKDTYINFYASENKNIADSNPATNLEIASDAKYKPLSMQHFESFFKLMIGCSLISVLVLILEILHFHLNRLHQMRKITSN